MAVSHWCFTINNPDGTDDAQLRAIVPHVEYLIFGKEVGESGTPHYQGFLILKNKQRMSYVKKLLTRAHLERRRGTPQQAIDYCKKDGDYAEIGQYSQYDPGSREKSRWTSVYEQVKSGDSLAKIIETSPNLIPYVNSLSRVQRELKVKPAFDGERAVAILWGPPKTGKTSRFFQKYGRENCYVVNLDDKNPFDDYDYEENIIVEDLKPMHHSVDLIKRLITTDLLVVPSRYNNKPCSWRRVLITSNFNSDSWWIQDPDREKVMSRIDHVEYIDSLDTPSELFPPSNPNKEKVSLYFVDLQAM